ncbi:MAG: CoA transferase subunit A [Elusimicrobia bacterium]|nr:CoA transferase subunit A [Elusimicrobiota bacterium]
MPDFIQPPDPEGFRRWNRDHKDMRLRRKVMSEREAVKRFIKSGDYLGFELYGTVRCPLSVVREIVRQGPRRLRLAGQGLMDVDFLLAAGLVESMDITYVGYEAYGLSPILRRSVESGSLHLTEWSNAALAWRFKAAAMGVPFLPARSMLGTDTFSYSNAKSITDPFTGLKVALLPALTVDCGVVHVHRADIYGNCQLDGISGFALEMARASKRLIVSAEHIIETEEILKRPEKTAIPFYLVDAVVHAPFGSHPGETCYLYARDEPHIKSYLESAKSAQGMRQYLDRYVYGVESHRDYLDLIGLRRLRHLVRERGR